MDHMDHHQRYGTTSLEQRSRSPSPMTGHRGAGGGGIGPGGHHHYHHQPHQHSYPVLATRRTGHGRRLPPTPNKPSTLQLKAPANINFPKLNASPTHGPLAGVQHGGGGAAAGGGAGAGPVVVGGPQAAPSNVAAPPPSNGLAGGGGGGQPQSMGAPGPGPCPLSFEQAVAIGRGGRLLPSPVPNGYKPQVSLSILFIALSYCCLTFTLENKKLVSKLSYISNKSVYKGDLLLHKLYLQ